MFLNLQKLQEYAQSSMEVKNINNSNEPQLITEGSAKITTSGKVFYNPVQEFNRDLSISIITTFSKRYTKENLIKSNKKSTKNYENISSTDTSIQDNGITILEALSATVYVMQRKYPVLKKIVANDISQTAVRDIKNNIVDNNVEDIVEASHCDATMLMYQHRREKQFDVIDLDPYGCPSIFLDSSVQAIKEGGLLLVTATDMAVLAGNSPETCYSKYGSIPLRIKSCHEMALRILLQCIEAHANRYGRYIVPLISLSADFYIRVFVRIFSGAHKCKFTTSKLSYVYHCTGCDTFTLQPLGILKTKEKQQNVVKFSIPTGPPASQKCVHCGHPHHIGGPIWTAPLHHPDFVVDVLNTASENLATFRRIQGVLSVIKEELMDTPLYYTLEKLCGTIHVETPPMLIIRSAILNAGYRVSFTHMNRTSIKTDAPSNVIWDIMRCWEKKTSCFKKKTYRRHPCI
ncbi:hypothetical protein NQ317_007282 [Molorchus minor]|uniref:tRNA (guanine(26)-N(2))-dimethyltransferase n=1 Tax=Molorchus minor TaxID=1323400 RepID=A0ABQ9JX71_9CUCU|nr:hypothetical protein NQ317_007282 [Molorchus minor]